MADGVVQAATAFSVLLATTSTTSPVIQKPHRAHDPHDENTISGVIGGPGIRARGITTGALAGPGAASPVVALAPGTQARVVGAKPPGMAPPLDLTV